MRVTKYNFLFVAGLVLTLGMSAAFANGYNAKAPKDMGTLSVQTNPESLSVKVDGRYVGMSRTGNKGAEFYLAPGFYTVEVTGPNGLSYTKNNVEIRRGKKNCICLTILNKPSCPYRFNLERSPDIITEGETVTFRMKDSGTGEKPTSYKWIVTPRTAADSMTGQGTSSIRVSSKDLAGQVIRAELDANNDNYVNDSRCTAAISVQVPKIMACPYRFTVDASAYSISEGETVTFTANNSGNAPMPTRYRWTLTPGTVANSVTGQGTSSITVSSRDFTGREIRAELDANDDNYAKDDRCTAANSVIVNPVEKGELIAWDLQKAILDNKIIQLSAKPNATLYVHIYPGTDKASTTLYTYDRVYRKINSYLTGPPKNIDGAQIKFEKGGTREGRTYVILQIVAPGANPPPVEPPPASRRPPKTR